jgi:ferredoxin
MQYAVVGLAGPLRESLDPWLCQDCGDCSTACPQDAQPRESMATLRRYLTAQYDWTGIAAKIHTSRAWAFGSLVFVGLFTAALVIGYHLSVVGMSVSDLTSQSMGLSHMFPTITYFTLAVILVPWLFLVSHAVRMHRFVMGGEGRNVPRSLYLAEAGTLFRHMFTQERMGKCPDEARRARMIKHRLMAAGVFAMFVLLVFFLRFFQTDALYPLWHPQRWIGYLAAAFMLYGTADIVIRRLEKKEEIYKRSELEDFTFPILLFLTAASGIAVHVFRYMGLPFAAHYTYFAHIVVSVPLLVVELPFGRWSHVLYRPLAIYLQAVKERAMALPPAAREQAA